MGHRHVIVKKPPAPIRGLPLHGAFSLSKRITGVDPRGLEPLASAMQKRRDNFADVRACPKTPVNQRIKRSARFLSFVSICPDNCRVTVNLLAELPGIGAPSSPPETQGHKRREPGVIHRLCRLDKDPATDVRGLRALHQNSVLRGNFRSIEIPEPKLGAWPGSDPKGEVGGKKWGNLAARAVERECIVSTYLKRTMRKPARCPVRASPAPERRRCGRAPYTTLH